MMYVFGEVTEPLDETTLLIEEIVRSQMTEILIRAVQQSLRRNSRYLSPEDVIFLIRHDRTKVNTLRTHLAFKDAQKSARKSGPPSEDIAEAVADEGEGGSMCLMKRDWAERILEKLIFFWVVETSLVKRKIKFSWDLINYYSSVLEDDDDEEDVDDEDEKMAHEQQLARLRVCIIKSITHSTLFPLQTDQSPFSQNRQQTK